MENRQSMLEISESAFLHNIAQIKNYVKDRYEIMPVIKANAYGTYINRNLKLIENFKIVAVAMVQEAIELRNEGFNNEILVLNQPYLEDIENIVKYNLTVGVSSQKFIDALGMYRTPKEKEEQQSKLQNGYTLNTYQSVRKKQKVKFHIELETGMGRTGVYIKDIERFVKNIKKYDNIEIEGVYTHLSSPDSDEIFTREQIKLFEEGLEIVRKIVPSIKYIHHSASNGILNFPNNLCNLVRPGLIMYGYPSSDNTLEKLDLRPVAKLKSKISFIKEVEKGASISYGRTFIAEGKMKIATVGIGYADGIRRTLSNNGEVVIRSKKAKIVGKVCMDSFMVDVTEISDVEEGDEVYIWDNEIIHLEDVAYKCGTINYEILSTISERVPRKFVD